jgi:hypothetical protein
MTYNPINANLIFRNDTVDPEFIKQYEYKTYDTWPQNWDMEAGYDVNRMKHNPLKSLDKGVENGFRFYLETWNMNFRKMNTICREYNQYNQIRLHHPAEVGISKNSNVFVPFNRIISLMVKPKITSTSDSLKSHDPKV